MPFLLPKPAAAHETDLCDTPTRIKGCIVLIPLFDLSTSVGRLEAFPWDRMEQPVLVFALRGCC